MADMVAIVQVNLVVADLDRSRRFYERLGFSFRSRSRLGVDRTEAWVSIDPGPTLVLHSPEFASWWDPNTAGPTAGGPQTDLELESAAHLDDVVSGFHGAGATVSREPVDMPWGQRFAIVVDPDGYRIGLKAPLPAGSGST
jgi:catechol 2,3-dioxygenase-like lactoylglutathione lyase family enzyme